MSTFVVKSPHRHSWPAAYWLAAVLLAAAVLAVGLGFTPEEDLTVDGTEVSVPVGSTVGDLADSGFISAKPGALLAIDGSTLKARGGRGVLIRRNDEPVMAEQRVYAGDVITSVDGADRVEETVLVREPLQFLTRVEGTGPVMRLAQPGSVGVLEVGKGVVSGIRSRERVVLPASDMVVRRTAPHPSEKLVALTFDDGPWPGQTEKILEILRREGVHATFFMQGGQVKRAPGLAKRVVAEGNLAGNHTLGHKLLTKQTPAEVNRQIAAGSSTIRSATGARPIWFRPPYGAIDGDVWKQTRALKLKVALWDIDTEDWRRPGVSSIVANVHENARAGSIILMHDGGTDRRQTIAALPLVIRDLKSRGFVFVTLEELDAAN